MKDYPQWKKLAWRYGRVFLAAFIGALAVQIQQQDFQINQALISSLITGAISTVFMKLRADLDNPSDPSLINKLPL